MNGSYVLILNAVQSWYLCDVNTHMVQSTVKQLTYQYSLYAYTNTRARVCACMGFVSAFCVRCAMDAFNDTAGSVQIRANIEFGIDNLPYSKLE